MALLIDSSPIITLERRGQEAAISALAGLGEQAAIAAITVSELLTGAYRADSPARRRVREQFVGTLLQTFPTLSFDLPAAQVHARIWAELTTAGQIIGPHDLIIAATALAQGYDVLMDNVREFERVPGLTVRRPER
ncbi:MAG TPA: PIN domain-containing protein [Dehalococcoidia bacterium]|nr:PIN domain-containing protein [Dehalococcoidia bacterium]